MGNLDEIRVAMTMTGSSGRRRRRSSEALAECVFSRRLLHPRMPDSFCARGYEFHGFFTAVRHCLVVEKLQHSAAVFLMHGRLIPFSECSAILFLSAGVDGRTF